MDIELTRRACEAYAFHGHLGLARHKLQYCEAVQDLENPDVWSSNKIFNVTAVSPSEIDSLLTSADEVFSSLSYRHFVIDPFTPPAFSAHLALSDYNEHSATVQMVLDGQLIKKAAGPAPAFYPVKSAADWATLRELVLADHAEGGRTQGSVLSESITDGIVASYRAKEGACQFFIAELNGAPCAYGSGINCPNDFGMVEDLFTLPKFRKRGMASAVIEHCVDYCRSKGAGPILIGSHANESPKHLYNSLGFDPVCLTRDYIKQL